MDFKKDYYKILEISETASKEEIKAAYRRLVKLYHPDSTHTENEDRIKLINEAKDVLLNDITREVYEEYRKEEKEREKKEKIEQKKKEAAEERNRKTKTTTRTITRERRIYITGNVNIKYYGEPEEETSSVLQTEFSYWLTPTDTLVTIRETDIHNLDKIPSHYQKSFTEADLFKAPLKQPIKCKVITAEGEEFYELELRDIRIKDIQLTGVTKHEGRTFGELTGEIFAYTPKLYVEELEETTSECFGPTGNFETKTEDDKIFSRQEFFNADCTKFWGPWERKYEPGPGSTRKRNWPPLATTIRKRNWPPRTTSIAEEPMGCLGWWWIPVLLLFLFLFPRLFLGILLVALFGLIIYFCSFLITLFSRIFAILTLLFFVFAIVTAIRSATGRKVRTVKRDTSQYDTLKTTQEPLPIPIDTSLMADSVINHFIRWRDYDTTVYQVNLAILSSDARLSQWGHSTKDFYLQNSLAPVYSYLEQMDTLRLTRIYTAFDSIRKNSHLDEQKFAEMVVSCIQSIPYYLVLDQSCDPSVYRDEFIYSYLSTCTGDCCIGNVKYGVRSPVEFMSDLKGDCDTRALIIYSILRKFKYNIALLTSLYYKHALIAINFKEPNNVNGLAMNIRNNNYYLWETTSKGFRPGDINPDLQNLDYWDITLLTENN